jgi:hypothetical protein
MGKIKLTVASTSSERAVLAKLGALSTRTVLKFLSASRATSACFLKEFSEGILTTAVGEIDINKGG